MSASSKLRLLITSGDGPRECQRAVALVIEQMQKEAREAGLTCSISVPDDDQTTEVRSALVELAGDRVSAFQTRWTGVIQWTSQSPFRPHHKRRNWFVGVFALRPDAFVSCKVESTDLTYETFRAGGPGGQHQNTTDSAVRLTHRPSGVSVISKDERSQHRNKQIALERLHARLFLLQQQQAARSRTDENRLHKNLERGNPVLRFRGRRFVES